MGRVLVLLAIGTAGCSLLFDPDALPGPPDLAVAVAPDMASVSEDLSVASDLTTFDLAPQCMVRTFNGFGGDAGISPIDCPCGCVIDPFTAPLNPARWTLLTNGTPGWSASLSGGVMQMTKGVPVNGDFVFIYSDQHFYLEGDFELRVDYLVPNWPVGGRAELAAQGPIPDLGASPLPTQVAFSYLAAGIRDQVILDTDVHDVAASPMVMSGTLQLTRMGARICGGVLGRDSSCRDGSGPGRLRIFVLAGVFSPTCAPSCGPIDMRFSNLRLVSGRLVPTP